MAVLETLWILIKSNASDVKKGAEEAERSTKKLNDSLKASNDISEHVGRGIANVAREFAGYVAGIVSAGSILSGLKNAIDYSTDLANNARLLGVNVEQLDEWGNAVQRTGGNAAQFQGSLRSLAEHLGTTPRVALKYLPQLADQLHRLNRFQAMKFGKMLGLDEATILLLQEGRREVEAIIGKQKELGIVTEKDAKISQAFNNELTDTSHAFRTLFTTLGIDALPGLGKFLHGITKLTVYLTHHKGLIVGALTAIGGAAALLAAPFVVANAAVLAVVASIGLLVAGFAIMFEDLERFKNGQNSWFGDRIRVGGGNYVTPEEGAENARKSFEIFQNLDFAHKLLAIVNGIPLNNETDNSAFISQAYQRNSVINTGPIAIHTQATDGPGIAKSLGKDLGYWQTANDFANGVAY